MDPHFNSGSNSIYTHQSRIQYDILCQVCWDYCSGKHYGVYSCDGCAGFFKRSIRMKRQYLCKNQGACLVNRDNRNRCRACRFQKCVQAGMIEDTVQDERGPRKSTLLPREMAKPTIYKSSITTATPIHYNQASSENAMDMGPPPSVSSGRPTQSSTYGWTAPPDYQPVTMMTNSSNFPPSMNSKMMHPKQANNYMHPYHHHQKPSIPHRPPAHTIDQLPVAERKPLATLSGPLLYAPKPKYAQPNVPVADPMPRSSNLETIYESASRLLFSNVRWAKSVSSFTSLPSSDQIILLEESWRELFVLGAAQFTLPIEADTLMTALGLDFSPSSVSSSERHKHLLGEIQILKETVAKFKQMNVDPTEYACLRAVILFKTSVGLRAIPSTTNLQDEAQLTLSRYISTAYPTQQLRFGRLLLLLPALRAIAASTIEELFFRKTIVNNSIERIVIDIYKSGDF